MPRRKEIQSQVKALSPGSQPWLELAGDPSIFQIRKVADGWPYALINGQPPHDCWPAIPRSRTPGKTQAPRRPSSSGRGIPSKGFPSLGIPAKPQPSR